MSEKPVKTETHLDAALAHLLADGEPSKDETIIRLRLEIERLRRDCAELYQVIGTIAEHCPDPSAPAIIKALDNASDAANGDPRRHGDLLPFVLPESASHQQTQDVIKMTEPINLKSLTKGKHGISMLTGRMRWRGSALEQEHAYQEYDEGTLTATTRTWEPVPTAMLCESCGTQTNDGHCDCTKIGTRKQKLVPFE